LSYEYSIPVSFFVEELEKAKERVVPDDTPCCKCLKPNHPEWVGLMIITKPLKVKDFLLQNDFVSC